MRQFLSQVSTVSTKNAWEHEFPLLTCTHKKVSVLKQVRLISTTAQAQLLLSFFFFWTLQVMFFAYMHFKKIILHSIWKSKNLHNTCIMIVNWIDLTVIYAKHYLHRQAIAIKFLWEEKIKTIYYKSNNNWEQALWLGKDRQQRCQLSRFWQETCAFLPRLPLSRFGA